MASDCSETVVTVVLCNKYLWFYVYFSDTEASQACFRLLHADDDDDDDDDDDILMKAVCMKRKTVI